MHDSTTVVAGCLALVAAGVHGIGGQILVVRRLTADRLASTVFGDATMTRAMIGVSWHLTTVGFVAAGCALVAAGSFLDGDAAKAAAVLGASQVTACAAVIVVQGVAVNRSLRAILRHPAPVLVTLTTVLAWIGAT